VTAIVNLKPTIPDASLNPLVEILQDSDTQIVRLAATGLTSFCATSPDAAKALSQLLDDSLKLRKLSGVEAFSTGSCTSEVVLAALGRGLAEGDKEVVLATIQTVGRLGPPGSRFRSDLERIVETHPDSSITSAAISALQRFR
jgi:hypothetical protein